MQNSPKREPARIKDDFTNFELTGRQVKNIQRHLQTNLSALLNNYPVAGFSNTGIHC